MRSRRSSRDSTPPSALVEDGDDSDRPLLPGASNDRQFALASPRRPNATTSYARADASVKKALLGKAGWTAVSAATTATTATLTTLLGNQVDPEEEGEGEGEGEDEGGDDDDGNDDDIDDNDDDDDDKQVVVPPSTPSASTTTTRSQPPPTKDKMDEARNYRRSRLRSSWSCSPATLTYTLLAALALWTIVQSSRQRQCDAKGCRMSHMSPVYLKANDFDTEHTRFASKYNLYLYRENGIDNEYPVRPLPPDLRKTKTK